MIRREKGEYLYLLINNDSYSKLYIPMKSELVLFHKLKAYVPWILLTLFWMNDKVKNTFQEIIWNIYQTEAGSEIYVRPYFSGFCIGNTLNTEIFQNKIKEVLKLREDHILNKKNLAIDIDSRLAKAFESSQMVARIFIFSLIYI